MRKIFLLLICGLIVNVGVSGCKGYSVSVNENMIYTPPPLFSDYMISDNSLSTCVKQTIYDEKITKAEELVRLNCSNAGITSAAGLDKFFALKELNLADNRLSTITEIGKLGRLETLLLNNNTIRDASPLLSLLHLKYLQLQNNTQLACSDLQQLFTAAPSLIMNPPTHCKIN